MPGRLRTSLNNGLNNGLRQSISGGVGAASIVTTGLSLHLDAGNSDSYSGSGTDWLDLTSNNVDFTLTNGPVYNSGFGGYFTFDGTDDYSESSSSYASFGTNPFTIEIWHRTHTASDLESIMSQNASTPDDTNWQIDFDTQKLGFNGGDSVRGSASTNSLNVWKQIVFVREGTATDQFKIYLNSSLDTTGTYSTNLSDAGPYKIARNRGGGKFFHGDISIVRVYNNKALSSSEVTQNFNANKGRCSL